MKKIVFAYLCFLVNVLHAQDVKSRLSQLIKEMEDDSSLRHAIVALSIVDSKTGKIVYEHNAQTGLAPASTQKLFTSCAAFDLLGKDYKYTTVIGYQYMKGNMAAGILNINSSGDPSFGSSRFAGTKPEMIIGKIVSSIQLKKITPFNTSLKTNPLFNDAVPGGWIWEDIGNYYGAAAQSFNWLENQYDLLLKSGSRVGDTGIVAAIDPKQAGNFPGDEFLFGGKLLSAEKGSGDNTIVYLPYVGNIPTIEGSIPVNENAFAVSASITNPANVFVKQVFGALKTVGITPMDLYGRHTNPAEGLPDSLLQYTELYKHISPPLDSLNYWFLKKSINLYGEALIKTMAYKQSGKGTTEAGVALLKSFWAARGIEKSAINICDGSGLSPQNRVTTDALVKVLQYAKTRSWYASFYYDLPEYNGMKMKSGSIGGARAYAGYHRAANGKEYTFAIIVNNYDGSALATVRKMYKVLDVLK